MRRSFIVRARRTTVALAAAVLLAGSVSGCYVYEPAIGSAIVPGKVIAIDLNDLGRLNLAPLIGPQVKRISGALVAQSNSDFVLRVSQLSFFNGKESVWSGEPVTISKDYVSMLYEEKLSPSRTALAVAAGAAGVGGLLAARNLAGRGSGSNEPQVPGTGTASRGNQ